MNRYDPPKYVLNRMNSNIMNGDYVEYSEVQKMLTEIRKTAYIKGYQMMIDIIIKREGYEVKNEKI